jgi:hypothetical protein
MLGGAVIGASAIIAFFCVISIDAHMSGMVGSGDPAAPTVQTRYGPIQGFVHRIGSGSNDFGGSNDNCGGRDAAIFLGVPYARPPTDDRRFEVVAFLHNY